MKGKKKKDKNLGTAPQVSGTIYSALQLTDPVAAARAVVATGAWVKSKHDMYLIRGSAGAYALFLPIRRRTKKKTKKNCEVEL